MENRTDNIVKTTDKESITSEGYILPNHYMKGKFQLIDIMEDILTENEFLGWIKGLILKYVASSNTENKLRKLTKAKYYLDEGIKFLSKGKEIKKEHLSPTYYKSKNFETIDIIEDELPKEELEGFYKGMVIRYIIRSSYKNFIVDDLTKAKYYLDKFVKEVEKKDIC